MDLLVQTRSAYKENYELGPDAQIQISVFWINPNQRYCMLSSAENEADYVESDENVLLHFDSRICTQIASLQPRMLQIHLLCVRMLEVSFRTACPSFTELHKNTEAALVTVTQPRQGSEIHVLWLQD